MTTRIIAAPRQSITFQNNFVLRLYFVMQNNWENDIMLENPANIVLLLFLIHPVLIELQKIEHFHLQYFSLWMNQILVFLNSILLGSRTVVCAQEFLGKNTPLYQATFYITLNFLLIDKRKDWNLGSKWYMRNVSSDLRKCSVFT